MATGKGRPLQSDRDRPQGERGPVKTLEKAHPPPDGQRPMPGNAQGTVEKPRIGWVHGSMDAKRLHLDKPTEGAQPGAGVVV